MAEGPSRRRIVAPFSRIDKKKNPFRRAMQMSRSMTRDIKSMNERMDKVERSFNVIENSLRIEKREMKRRRMGAVPRKTKVDI